MTLVYGDPGIDPGTHVLIVGVGAYPFGRGTTQPSLAAGGLSQLTSPPVSARAVADWFISSFRNRDCPLASVELLISEAAPTRYQPPRPAGAGPVIPSTPTLENVRAAAKDWGDRLQSNKDNMAAFYFCGHGVSVGQQAALLLADFGKPGSDYDGAIDLNLLTGTMRNSPAIRQVYLLDCCRTRADGLYEYEPMIGSRIRSQASNRGHDESPQQFVLFPTLDGEEAFGAPGSRSAFATALLEALDFAAADRRTGTWRTSTTNLHDAIDQLISFRVPPQLRGRSKPSAVESTRFFFNDIDPPTVARSYVTVSDVSTWNDDATIECEPKGRPGQPLSDQAADHDDGTYCRFELDEGCWSFKGRLTPPHEVAELEQVVAAPVAYITLEVKR